MENDPKLYVPGQLPIDTSMADSLHQGDTLSFDTNATHPHSHFLKGLEDKETKFLEMLADRQKAFEEQTAKALRAVCDIRDEELRKVLEAFTKRVDAVFLLQQNLENVLDAFIQLAWLEQELSPAKKQMLSELVIQFLGRNLPKEAANEDNVH